MTKALPFTQEGIARALAGITKAGKHAVGFRPSDGMILIGDKPLDVTTLMPNPVQNDPASKWEDGQS